ncbi:MAG TPA: hypothetical protein VKM72_32380 [Thermoanaerobaculia bacterium]|nr:hypothetical protein [Thermoanaerobaculia bacterium]
MKSAAAAAADPVRRIDPAALTAPAAVDRLRVLALGAGVIGAVLLVIGFFVGPEYFFRSYLVGWVFWTGVALGSLALLMVQTMTRGAWGVAGRRVMEAASRTLPWMLLLAIPLVLGFHQLYPAGHEAHELSEGKASYLSLPGFVGRLAVYFAVWLFLTFSLNRLSAQQDREANPDLIARMKRIAAPGIPLWGLCVTFASIDWLMALDPHWYSTMYGVWLLGSMGLSAISFLILMSVWLWRREPMNDVLRPSHFHDWGKLMLAFTMLWAYFSFSQFLIMWAGNLPEEIVWYKRRVAGGWGAVALIIVLLHFALPFLLLLSRDLKRNPRQLVFVAGLMLVMRVVDLFWQVEPGFEGRHVPALYWMYAAAPLAIGGLWLWLFLGELKKRPLLPVNDPYLPEALAHE